MSEKIILAYSGGLDTSVAIAWLSTEKKFDVIALAVDVGQPEDFKALTERGYQAGAKEVIVLDKKEAFAQDYAKKAILANALYEGRYPLVSSLSRPLIASELVNIAKERGASYVAHGCTGKGNDQVRFEVSISLLAPELKIVAPVREWGMSREESIKYGLDKGLELSVTQEKIYSIDENLFGRAIECGILEDPWASPPEDIWQLTKKSTNEDEQVLIGFERGVPASVNGEYLKLDELILKLNPLVGRHGFGRIDMVENRRVGIKSRETYEAPAALVLINAHRDLEGLTLERELAHEKQRLEPRWAELAYDGMWFSPLMGALNAFILESQESVSGEVRMLLTDNYAAIQGRKSASSLYVKELATYEDKDEFSHKDAEGFINLYGLSVKTWAQVQRKVKKIQ